MTACHIDRDRAISLRYCHIFRLNVTDTCIGVMFLRLRNTVQSTIILRPSLELIETSL